MKLDEIIILLGEFGKYQKLLFLFVCIPAMFIGSQGVSSVFTLFIPKHRCSIPDIENDTYNIQGHWHEVLVNRSIPLVKVRDDVYEYAECDMFSTNQNTSFTLLNATTNTSKTECKKWVYDSAIFENTFITQDNLVCSKKIARANAFMFLAAGTLIGSPTTGIFADMFGRKKALVACTFLHIGAAFGSAFSTNYTLFVFFRFLVGFSNIGMYLTTYIIGIELVGPSRRMFAGFLVQLSFSVGLYFLCFTAYFVRSWSMLQLALACPTVLIFVCLWVIPESPRWLVSKGRYDEANEVIQKCAKVNRVSLPENVVGSDSQERNERQSVLRMVTIPKLLLRNLIIYFIWFAVVMAYYGLSLNVANLDGNIYINFALNCTMELAGYTFCLLTLNKVGRRTLYAGAMVFCGASCVSSVFAMFIFESSMQWIKMVLPNIGKFGVSIAYSVIYVWSAELFPTNVRNSCLGSTVMIGWAGSSISPYVADVGKFVDVSFGKALPLIIFGSISVLAGLLSLALPETKGKRLPETIEDAVNLGKKKRCNKANPSTNIYYINNDAYENDRDHF